MVLIASVVAALAVIQRALRISTRKLMAGWRLVERAIANSEQIPAVLERLARVEEIVPIVKSHLPRNPGARTRAEDLTE